MESTLRMAVGFIYFLAGLTWLGAAAFAGYRVYQMRTLPSVEAEVVQASTESYTSTSYRRDATNWNRPVRSRMYSAAAVVRYSRDGKVITAEAGFDTGFSWKWVQDRLVREWTPGSRVRVYLDPAKESEPLIGLGANLNTFLPSGMIAFFGFFLYGCGYGVARLVPAVMRLIDAVH